MRRDVGSAVGVFGMLKDRVGFEVFKDNATRMSVLVQFPQTTSREKNSGDVQGRGIEIALERQRYWWKAIER